MPIEYHRLATPPFTALIVLLSACSSPGAGRSELQAGNAIPRPNEELPTPASQSSEPSTPEQREQIGEGAFGSDEGTATPTQPSDTLAPDAHSVATAEALASTLVPEFGTAEYIDAQAFGIVADGRSDNTERLRQLLSGGNRTIRFGPGDYLTSAVNIASRTVLLLEPGVTIRDAGRLAEGQPLLNIVRAEDVRIVGFGARVIANRDNYTTGEHRHGVIVYASSRIAIEGLESSGHGGDGFYIGGLDWDPSTDILLRGCAADNNRRQGLSITSARRVVVSDCEFSRTYGTAPGAGVDLEPNNPSNVLDNIVFVRPRTRGNSGGGMMIHLLNQDATSEPVSVTIIDHYSVDEMPPLRTHLALQMNATLRYSRLPTGGS